MDAGVVFEGQAVCVFPCVLLQHCALCIPRCGVHGCPSPVPCVYCSLFVFCWFDVCFCVYPLHCDISFLMTAVVLSSWLSPAIGMLLVCVLLRPVCVFCAIMRNSLLCHVCIYAFLSLWFRICELLLGVCHGAMASMSALCC